MLLTPLIFFRRIYTPYNEMIDPFVRRDCMEQHLIYFLEGSIMYLFSWGYDVKTSSYFFKDRRTKKTVIINEDEMVGITKVELFVRVLNGMGK